MPLLSSFPDAKELLGDKGYDSDWFRTALTERGITAQALEHNPDLVFGGEVAPGRAAGVFYYQFSTRFGF